MSLDTNSSRSPKPRKALRWLFTSTGLVAVLSGTALLAVIAAPESPAAQSNAGPPPVPVTVHTIASRDVTHQLDAVGTVQSLQDVVVRAQVDGILVGLDFVEGEIVQRGQLLARIDDRALRAALSAAEAQLARDEALLVAAERDLERYRALIDRNGIAQQALDQQTAQTEQARAVVRLDQANVETARINLSHTRIFSPVTGRVGLRRVDVGNLIRASDADGLTGVTQIDPISIVFAVPQQSLQELQIQVAAPGGARVEAVDRQTSAVLAEGLAVALDNSIDPRSGSVRARAQFENADARLTPGAFVGVRVATGTSPKAIAAPTAAVRPGTEGPFVYRIRDSSAERIPVQVGYADDQTTVILGGLAAGDVVVTDGYSRLSPGASVRVISNTPEADQ